jgi:catechol 2,3-dioxygenase-like lactoylglutathione lyase family enzyme
MDETTTDLTSSAEAEREMPGASFGTMALWVSDFPAMRHFYSEVLGLPEVWYGNRLYDCVVYDDGTFMLCKGDFTPSARGWALCPKPGSEGEHVPYFTFYVPDIQSVVERGRAAGIIFRTEEPFSLGGSFGLSIEARDPDGNPIAITQKG